MTRHDDARCDDRNITRWVAKTVRVACPMGKNTEKILQKYSNLAPRKTKNEQLGGVSSAWLGTNEAVDVMFGVDTLSWLLMKGNAATWCESQQIFSFWHFMRDEDERPTEGTPTPAPTPWRNWGQANETDIEGGSVAFNPVAMHGVAGLKVRVASKKRESV